MTRYPAIFVGDVLVATPKDFGFYGTGEGSGGGRYAPLRSEKAHERFRRDLARMIENNIIKRPEFAGVNSPVSTKGEGGQALARGEGDMALQAICEILPYKEIELVGPVPRELAAWIGMSAAVSARSTQPDKGQAFIRYLVRPESTSVWTAKGTRRFQ